MIIIFERNDITHSQKKNKNRHCDILMYLKWEQKDVKIHHLRSYFFKRVGLAVRTIGSSGTSTWRIYEISFAFLMM